MNYQIHQTTIIMMSMVQNCPYCWSGFAQFEYDNHIEQCYLTQAIAEQELDDKKEQYQMTQAIAQLDLGDKNQFASSIRSLHIQMKETYEQNMKQEQKQPKKIERSEVVIKPKMQKVQVQAHQQFPVRSYIPVPIFQQKNISRVQNIQKARVAPKLDRKRQATLQQNITNLNVDKMTNEEIYEYFTNLDAQIKKGLTTEQISALSEFDYKQKIEEAEDCQVCKDTFEMGERLVILPCIHHFHRHCIHEWLSYRNYCPLCLLPLVK